MPGTALVAIAFAYAVGCLNASYYLLRWCDGRDIRDLGSGNAGARNAGRILGRRAFALVFVLDAAKGLLAVLAAQVWAPDAAPLCTLAATLGHVFPAQLRWRGGKGVATAIGALAMLDIAVLAVVAAAFCVWRPILRRTVPAGMLSFACGAAFALMVRPPGTGFAALALAALLVYTHYRGWRRRGQAVGSSGIGDEHD
jgi:glycerol-3-phosphate acyltransferase PlsY